MAIKPNVVRRKPVEEPEVEPEEYEEEGEEVEEEPTPKKRVIPPTVMRKVVELAPKKVVRQVVEDEEGEEVEEVEEVKEVKEEPALKKRVVPPAPVSKQTTDVKVKTVATTVVDSLLPGLLEGLENGKAIIITRLSDDKWQVAKATGQVSGSKLSSKEYEMAVHTDEYLAWAEEWRTKTAAEKIQFAKTNKIQYPKHDDPRVEAIGLAEAVMEHLGIDKYKPGYERPSVRRALRGK